MKEQYPTRPESRKTVSIIVPVYKTERFLSACIASILAQTFTDFELILVDDGSPDNCPALCDAAAAKAADTAARAHEAAARAHEAAEKAQVAASAKAAAASARAAAAAARAHEAAERLASAKSTDDKSAQKMDNQASVQRRS